MKFDLNKMNLKLRKASPKIFLVTGVIGVVGSAVLACKETLKVDDILKESKENLKKVDETLEKYEKMEDEEEKAKYTEKDAKKDRLIIKTQTGLKLVKNYAPSVILGSLSITSIVAGHKILTKRNASLSAAYAAVDQSYKAYRKKMKEILGEEKEEDIRFGVEKQDVETGETTKDGKPKTIKKRVATNPAGYSPYAKFFDEGSYFWKKDADRNYWFLVSTQNQFNERLKAKGRVFLNEVYAALDIPETKAGQQVGWVYDPENPMIDNYIDFGLADPSKDNSRRFVNGDTDTILLDFNVDGIILDYFDREF